MMTLSKMSMKGITARPGEEKRRAQTRQHCPGDLLQNFLSIPAAARAFWRAQLPGLLTHWNSQFGSTSAAPSWLTAPYLGDAYLSLEAGSEDVLADRNSWCRAFTQDFKSLGE